MSIIKYLMLTGLMLLVAACASSPGATALSTQSNITAQPSQQSTEMLPVTSPITTEPASTALPTLLATTNNTPIAASTNPSGTVIDPCTLITKAEAEEILGKEVGAPDRTPQGPTGEWCAYQVVGASDTAVVGVETGVSTDNFKARAEEEAGLEVTPVPGLGDEAYSALSVYVRKGDILLVVSLDAAGFTTLKDRIDATVKLAQKAVARLP